ncbi:MAG: hypothetical protein KDB27_31395, partial [Planctomycetales bacterium]|nr:hypothetical protein [Planctomycetales bacterium]
PTVERVILACLQRAPEDRPDSARLLSQALPGGDPLEAAIAAGTTPAPILIANAEDKNRLPFKVGIALLCVVAVGLGITIYNGRKLKRMFETSPQVLSDRCAEIIEELGYSDLPKNTRFGAAVDRKVQKEFASQPIKDRDAWLEMHGSPMFQFWRRWTDGEFMVEEYHGAFVATAKGPIKQNEKEVTVVIDPKGQLLELKVSGLQTKTEDTEQPTIDWSKVLQLAGLELADGTATDLVSDPSVFCIEKVAWEFGTGENKRLVQAGALRGKCNYFEISEIKKKGQDKTDAPKTLWVRIAENSGMVLFSLVKITFVLLAWVNLRASRADLNGALRAAAFVFGLYVIQEVLSLRMTSPTFWRSLLYELWEDRPFGHMIGHAFHICIIYLGIEPYVRRHWPRSLVGLARLLDLRWTDQRIGQELLIGVSAGGFCLIATRLLSLATENAPFETVDDVLSYCQPALFVAVLSNRIATVFLVAFVYTSFCVLVRILVKRVRFEIAILTFFVIFGLMNLLQADDPSANQIFVSLLFPFVFVTLFLRFGFLACCITMFTMYSCTLSLPVNPESWYAGYAFIAFAIPAVLALFGFVTSQGGISKLLTHLEPRLEGQTILPR